MQVKLLSFFSSLALFFASIRPVSAQQYYCNPADPSSGVNTALGCIKVHDTTAFLGWLLGWAVGVAGGIAFLLIVVAIFQIMTSAGNPEKIKGGKELLTAAISGLLFIIFSIFLLELIGVKILAIPGLG